eukprot:1173698-Pleurochrysis_carterae.AAC.1
MAVFARESILLSREGATIVYYDARCWQSMESSGLQAHARDWVKKTQKKTRLPLESNWCCCPSIIRVCTCRRMFC